MRRRECFALLGGAMIFAAFMVVSPAASNSRQPKLGVMETTALTIKRLPAARE